MTEQERMIEASKTPRARRSDEKREAEEWRRAGLSPEHAERVARDDAIDKQLERLGVKR